MDRFTLECFVTLAEELHFRRAAERCHITQPAISHQLRRLESQLQVALVHRTKRVVRVTAAGEVFQREARRTLAQMDRAEELTLRTARGEIGQLTVGITAPCLYVVLPEIARLLRENAPDLGLVVHEMTTADQERALRNGDIDVGVVHPPTDDQTLVCTEIADPPFWLALPADHALAAEPTVDLADLASEAFVLFPREIGPRLYDTIISACRGAGFSPRLGPHAHPAQSIIAMVAAGFGVGLIAAEVQRLDRPGVVYRPIRVDGPTLGIGVAVMPGRASPSIDVFVQAAITAGRNLR